MQEAVKDEFYKDYTDRAGLGLLEIGKKNDNGILFLVIFQMLCKKLGVYNETDAIKFLSAHDGIRVAKGEYKRHPDDTRGDAHDNMVGIVSGAVLAETPSIIHDICDLMDRTGGVSDHRNGSKWDFVRMRQGSEIAFYQICCGRIPSILDMAWLCGGMVVNIIWGNWSSKNLGWLRVNTINRAGYSHLPNMYQLPLFLSILFWDIYLYAKYKTILHSFERYYIKSHPINKMQRLINEQNID